MKMWKVQLSVLSCIKLRGHKLKSNTDSLSQLEVCKTACDLILQLKLKSAKITCVRRQKEPQCNWRMDMRR